MHNDASTGGIIIKSDDKQDLPNSWQFTDSTVFTINEKDNSWQLSGNVEEARGNTKMRIDFEPKGSVLKIQIGKSIVTGKCERTSNWRDLLAQAKTGVSASYVENRLSTVPFGREKVGTIDFNRLLAKAAYDKEDFKMAYTLLSPLNPTLLSMQDKDIIETSKSNLVHQSADTRDVWEWNHSWQTQGGNYYLQDFMVSACNAMSESPQIVDYSIVSSTPQDRIGASGLTCHGTLHVIKKEGQLQSDKKNNILIRSYLD